MKQIRFVFKGLHTGREVCTHVMLDSVQCLKLYFMYTTLLELVTVHIGRGQFGSESLKLLCASLVRQQLH
jgi:hypothetical protein